MGTPRNQITRPATVDADSLSLWRDKYLERLATLNYSALTIHDRRHATTIFMSWCSDRDLTRANQITRPILEAYQRWLWNCTKADGKRIGWSTQRNRLIVIKHWFRWMTRENVLMHNPASELEMPRKEKRLPVVALSLAQVESLMAVPNVINAVGVRDRAMLELFYSCGLRRTELCNLEMVDFNEDRRTIHVRLGKGKKDRIVPVGERAVQWLAKYLTEVRPRQNPDTRIQALFLNNQGNPFTGDLVGRMVTAMMEKAGLAGMGSCHMLRHCCATHMLEGGADIRYIQQLLGHERLETTAVYTEVSIKQLQEVHSRCHPLGRLAGESVISPGPVAGPLVRGGETE